MTTLERLEACMADFRHRMTTFEVELKRELMENYEEETKLDTDKVNHPHHYTYGKVECIDAIESVLHSHVLPIDGYLTAQVIKYMWRWNTKNGVEDLYKAKWYLERLIKKEEKYGDAMDIRR